MGRFLQGYINSTTLLVVSALLSLLILLNLLGCVWWTIAVLEGIENSWAGQVGKLGWVEEVASLGALLACLLLGLPLAAGLALRQRVPLAIAGHLQ
mgnify:FL=1